MPRRRNKANNADHQQLVQLMAKLMATKPISNPAPKPKPRRRPRKEQITQALGEGSCVMMRHELAATVKVAAAAIEAHGSFSINPTSFPYLKMLSLAFERSKWHSVKIVWRPAVSVTTAGMISYGINWDFAEAATTRERISAYTPSAAHALWVDGVNKPLVLPQGKLQSRAWYNHLSKTSIDAGPAELVYAVTAPKNAAEVIVGEFWITYKITLQGTAPGPAT